MEITIAEAHDGSSKGRGYAKFRITKKSNYKKNQTCYEKLKQKYVLVKKSYTTLRYNQL